MNKRKIEHPFRILKRVLSFVLKRYKLACLAVLVLIIVSSIANVMGSLFIRTLIDDYIAPYINTSNPNFNPLLKAL